MDDKYLRVKDTVTLGAVIRTFRKKEKLRQSETAGLCGVGTRFLSELENGKPSVQLGRALKVLHGLGLVVYVKRREFDDQL